MNISNNSYKNLNFLLVFVKASKIRVYTCIYTYIHFNFYFIYFTLEKVLISIFIFTQKTQKTQNIYIHSNNVILGEKTQKTQNFLQCFFPTPLLPGS